MIEYLLRTDLGREVGTVIEEPELELHTPALCDIELAAGLRRMIRVGDLDVSRATAGLAIYLNLPLVRHGHRGLVTRVLELGDNFSAHDAAYVALCERLGGTLITGDGGLTRAVRQILSLNVIGVGA
jgi:predicted nucleic acid-binding protein